MGGFSNPISNAAGGLIRVLLKSANFVAGVSGWQITKTGSAQFNDVTIVGNDLKVLGSNGSQVEINTSNFGTQAQVLLSPPTQTGGITQTPGGLVAFATTPGSPKPTLQVFAPAFNGHTSSFIDMVGTSADGAIEPALHLAASNGGVNGDVQLWSAFFTLVNGSGTVNMPMGRAGYVDAQADSANIGAVETVVMTIAAPIIRNNRAYELVVKHSLNATAAAVTTLRVRQNSAVGAVISDRFVETSTNFQSSMLDMGKIKNVSGADINNKDAVLTLSVPAGTVKQVASAQHARSFELWDIGTANDFPNAIPW